MNKALFLDRDGVVIVEKNYLKNPEEVELIPGIGESLKKAQDAGYLLFIVSNQSGIGRGLITMEESNACFAKTLSLLAEYGVKITEVYFAPEHPDAPSIGRKPSPYFVGQACLKYDVNPRESFFIGDRLSDIQCSIYSGVSPILVLTGYGSKNKNEVLTKYKQTGCAVDLNVAIRLILP